MDQPVLAVYDRAGVFHGWLRAPMQVRIQPRWIDVGTAELTVTLTDPLAEVLRSPGTRVMCSLRGEHVLGGPVTAWRLTGPADAHWAFTVTDDAYIAEQIYCAPSPSAPLTGQSTGSDTRNGKLESVIKSLAAANAPRSGIPVDIAVDKGRGPTVTLAARWQPLSDVIGPSLRAAGMSLVVTWRPDVNRLLLDVAEAGTYPVQLSVESKTITAYDVSAAAPTATRVVVGPGEGTSFQQIVNATAETAYGPLLAGETFRTAETTDEASTAASDALNDANAKSGLAVSLAESPFVRYGGLNGLHVGDRATLRIGDVEITDVVREAVITWQVGQPLTITPAVGAWDANPSFALAGAVQRLAASVRRYLAR